MMPSGIVELTYEDLAQDIERLVSMKSGLYIIPGYDREDIGQEIRMTCVKAISKYDAEKNHSTPFHFLARCVDNRLRNLLRDNAATLTKAQKDDPKAIARSERKKRLQYTLSVGHDIEEGQLGASPGSIFTDEFREAIASELPVELLGSLALLMASGPPSIPKAHLKVIKQAIRTVYPGWSL